MIRRVCAAQHLAASTQRAVLLLPSALGRCSSSKYVAPGRQAPSFPAAPPASLGAMGMLASTSVRLCQAPASSLGTHNDVSQRKKSGSSSGGGGDWAAEPTLDDLDISIPAVDGDFIARLVEVRSKERHGFLEKRDEIWERVEKQKADFAAAEKEEKAHATGTNKTSSFGKRKKSTSPDDAVAIVENAVVGFKPDLSNEEMEIYMHTRPEYDDGFCIIDTRTVNEVTSWGMIEGSKVLPAHDMYDAFMMAPDEFLSTFGFEKPHPDQTVIFYCQYGTRSLMAAQILSWMGYPKVMYLRDGYYEWSKRFNILLKKWATHDHKSGNNVKRIAAFQAAKEIQRDIAPEFNELPMIEAERLSIDETRSRGSKKVGESLLSEAQLQLASRRHLVLDEPLPEGHPERQKTNTAGAIPVGATAAVGSSGSGSGEEEESLNSPEPFRDESEVMDSVKGTLGVRHDATVRKKRDLLEKDHSDLLGVPGDEEGEGGDSSSSSRMTVRDPIGREVTIEGAKDAAPLKKGPTQGFSPF